jgi:glycosyltransferase involved in cell wall biosynthesis
VKDWKPQITIITASYNSERTIERTIASVLNQTYPNIEYIIVDGASRDRTMEIVDKYSDRIDRIISEPDEGIYDAFNKGVKAAMGELILFLNSDDYLYAEDVIAKVANKYIECGPETRAVYGKIFVVDEEKGLVRFQGMEMGLKDVKEGRMPPHPAFFARRDLFEELGYFDASYRIAGDYDFIAKLFKKYEKHTYFLDEIITVFTTGGISVNLANKPKIYDEVCRSIKKNFGSDLEPGYKYGPNEIHLDYMTKWLESILFRQKYISSVLYEKGMRNVAIFGSMETALFVLKDALLSGVRVHAFLDNSPERQGMEICGIKVYPVDWLRNCPDQIEAVVLAIRGDYEVVVREQLRHLILDSRIRIVSWRELVAGNI